MITFLRRPLFRLFLSFIIPLTFYALTLCPTVYCGDSGELAVAAANLQIAHPPGYPLLTNVGHIWVSIFFFLRPILALNWLVALFAATTGMILFSALSPWLEAANHWQRLSALALAILFTLGQTLWSVATNFEVYAPGAFLISLTMSFLLRFYRIGCRQSLLITFYLFGLALTNHLSALSLLPALLLTIYFHRGQLSRRWLVGILGAGAFPLSFYLYLYFRSSPDLVLSWQNPSTSSGLIHHLTAGPYQGFIASFHLEDVLPYLGGLVQLFSAEFALPLVVLALPGIYFQFRRDWKIAVVMLSIITTNCAVNFNYLIPDIGPYYVPSLVVLVIWIGECLLTVARTSRLLSAIVSMFALIILGITAVCNFNRSDLSERRSAEQYARDLFENVPQRGTLFCNSDNSLFPALYLRYVENYRPDCNVYGQLPTESRFRAMLTLNDSSRDQKITDLLRFAVTNAEETFVFAREPMLMVNDFRNFVPDLYPSGLVYYSRPGIDNMAKRSFLDWRHPPELHDPKEALLYTVYYLLNGEAQLQAKDDEGEQLLTKAVEIVGRHSNFLLSNEVASFLSSIGSWRLSCRAIEYALTITNLRYDQRLRLLTTLGTTLVEAKDYQRGREVLQKVVQMKASNDVSQITLSVARFNLMVIDALEAAEGNRPKEAISVYKKMLGIFPDQTEINLQLGRLYLKVGDTTSAKAMFEICLKRNHRSAEIPKLQQ